MIDLVIVLLFVAYALYSGFSSRSEAGKDLKQYFLAGNTLKGWKAGVSMAATQAMPCLPFWRLSGCRFFQMNSDGTGYLAQRMIACRSDRQAKIAAVLFTRLQILLRSLIWLIIGVGILVLYPFDMTSASASGFAAERELLFVTGINDLLPVGIKGIMLTGLLGALASTLDTHLNWGASYWSNDIYQDLFCKKIQKREPKSSELVWVARFSNRIILFIALAIMVNLGSIQQAWFITLLFGAGMGSVLVLRWVWERTNFYSEMSAIAVSLIVAPVILITTDAEWVRLLLMSLISTVVVVIVTLITPDTKHSVLDAFYRQINPIGFWSKTATRVGDPAKLPLKKLGSSLYDILISAVSLFSLLVGLGKLMFRPTSESVLLPLVLIVVGVALVPLWWKSVMSVAQEASTDPPEAPDPKMA